MTWKPQTKNPALRYQKPGWARASRSASPRLCLGADDAPLADHGARVMRIESESRPDVLRGGNPFKDAEPGLDRSQFFGDFNTSKESITLNMKHPEAIEIAREIVKRSDDFLH